MHLYESAEDYLERILMIKLKKGKVRSIDIASEMNFSKASVSIAMKKLRENNYIDVDEDGYITLTEQGNEVATKIYERHTVLTQILIKIGVEQHIAETDACKIEHDICDDTFQALKNYFKIQ